MAEDMTMTGARTSDDYIRAIARSEAKVEALTESMRELRKAVEELIDRVDADVDALRTKAENFAVTAAAVEDLKRRTTIVETKLEVVALDNAKLETKLEAAVVEKTKLETRLEAITARVYLISGAAGTIAWIAGKLLR